MTKIRQAEAQDVSAISHLYRQLVHPVTPDIEVDVREDRIIDEDQKRKGYGTMLARYLDNFCLEADCSKIMLLSNSRRSEAHTFFEKQGYSSKLKKGFVKYRSQLRRSETAIR
jgi:GNAT superfamily N-acetyltransferase